MGATSHRHLPDSIRQGDAVAIKNLHVAGYRSVREVRLRLGQVNVLVGPNGCGKSNLYRALYLLSAAAAGQFSRSLAEEGGMPSVLWAGPRFKGPVRMTVGVQVDDLEYELSCGLMPPTPGGSAFDLDPHVKEESLRLVEAKRRTEIMKRTNASVTARDDQGSRVTFPSAIGDSESVMAELREPHRFPVLSAFRQEFLSWRFYHQFRTDADSPLREPQVGIRTPVLSHDGRDLAAALQTIIEVGDRPALLEAITRAFPGAELIIESARSRFSLSLLMPEFHRPFEARELSDGTLHYLCLLAALLSPRPPSLLALNEPETSVHPDLIGPLAKLIARASQNSQVWITTHSQNLAEAVQVESGIALIRLEKVQGETRVIYSGESEPD
jgi:predicted ATPase